MLTDPAIHTAKVRPSISKRLAVATLLAVGLGLLAVPVASAATNVYYADLLATKEDVKRGTKTAAWLIGGGGSCGTNIYRCYVVNARGDGIQLGSSFTDVGGGLAFNHTGGTGYGNCWWTKQNGSSTGSVGLSCYVKK